VEPTTMRDRSLSYWFSVDHSGALHQRFAHRILGVATLHGKESVIGPALMKVLPLAGHCAIPNVDTDRFGAFSGEVQRTCDARTAAIAKAKHGAEVSGMDLVIASEGSFGPYPPSPFIPCDEEFLVLYDARDGAVFEHRHVSLETVFGGERCVSLREVMAFAERMNFPAHGLVLRTKERWDRGDALHKGIRDRKRLRELAGALIDRQGSVWVETDMRAMENPTRMAVIAEAADRFASELARLCPNCGELFFRVTGTVDGLPCGLCGMPTASIRSYLRTCRACNHSTAEPRPDGKVEEDPRYCDHCNP
jgi:hypothetical protein